MNAAAEREALHLILVSFLMSNHEERSRTEERVRKTVVRAQEMGVVRFVSPEEWKVSSSGHFVLFGDGPKSELMDYYLDLGSG